MLILKVSEMIFFLIGSKECLKKHLQGRHLSAWHRKGFLHCEHIPPVAGMLMESSECPLPVKLYLI